MNYGIAEVTRLTKGKVAEATIHHRFYTEEICRKKGVELDEDGHKVISEENFKKYKWDKLWRRGRKAKIR